MPLLGLLLIASPMQAESMDDLIKVLQDGDCRNCRLADADLVHADLRDADLRDARLQRANLGEAKLDGADLRGANLSFTSLRGASLRGANLEGSILHGTDLRNADLSGARLSPNALEEAHWSGTTGLPAEAQSHAALHNAGVAAAEGDRWKQAEELFGLAIRNQPDSAESWVARGIAREQLGKRQLAIQDFSYASRLYKAEGLIANAEQLQAAAQSMQNKESKKEGGNGMGSALLSGVLSTSKALMPLAMKLFMPALPALGL